MTNREKKLTAGLIFVVVLLIGALIGLGIMAQEESKYEAILDMACDFSGNSYSCEQGMKMLKGMSTEDIRNFNPYRYFK